MPLGVLLLTTVVPLHFAPPVETERRFLYTMRRSLTIDGRPASHEDRLDLKVRVSGRNEQLTAVDTTILRARFKVSPNLADYPRVPALERLAKGTVARAMVTPNGGVAEMNVLKTASYEKGVLCGATVAPLAAFDLHSFWLPGRLVRVGDKWTTEFEVKRPLEFEGITAPEKTFPVQYKLVQVRDFHGVKHARVHFAFSATTDAEKDGKRFVLTTKEEGDGWINVKTGLPRQMRTVSYVTASGDYRMQSKIVTMLVAQ